MLLPRCGSPPLPLRAAPTARRSASNTPYLKRLSDRVPFNKEDEIGEVKFANCQQFCAVFPEYQYVFVGDSGQADALTAQLLTNGKMAEGLVRPITTP